MSDVSAQPDPPCGRGRRYLRHAGPGAGDRRSTRAPARFFHPFRLARLGWIDRYQKGAIGLVQAYVCRACGFTELYTRAADQISIDGTHVREIVGPESDAPYR
jgi:hypothetical protein